MAGTSAISRWPPALLSTIRAGASPAARGMETAVDCPPARSFRTAKPPPSQSRPAGWSPLRGSRQAPRCRRPRRRSAHRASSNGWSRELCKRAQFCHYGWRTQDRYKRISPQTGPSPLRRWRALLSLEESSFDFSLFRPFTRYLAPLSRSRSAVVELMSWIHSHNGRTVSPKESICTYMACSYSHIKGHTDDRPRYPTLPANRSDIIHPRTHRASQLSRVSSQVSFAVHPTAVIPRLTHSSGIQYVGAEGIGVIKRR